MVFKKLRQIRDFERRHLDFLHSREDRDLVISIGHGQELGQPVSFKQLAIVAEASPSTLQRRLNRLIDLGIVMRCSDGLDRRSNVYTITPSGLEIFKRFEKILNQACAPRQLTVKAE